MDNKNGIAVGFLGLPIFRDKEGRKHFVGSMPMFFLKYFQLLRLDVHFINER